MSRKRHAGILVAVGIGLCGAWIALTYWAAGARTAVAVACAAVIGFSLNEAWRFWRREP